MEERSIPRHKQNSWIYIRTIIFAREDKKRKIHIRAGILLHHMPSNSQAQQGPSAILALLHPVVFPPGKTYGSAEDRNSPFFFFLMLTQFPSCKGTFDYEIHPGQGWKEILSAPTSDKNRSTYLLALWSNKNLKECFGCYFVLCNTDKITCSAETWCLTVMAVTVKSTNFVFQLSGSTGAAWHYTNHPSVCKMKNTAL